MRSCTATCVVLVAPRSNHAQRLITPTTTHGTHMRFAQNVSFIFGFVLQFLPPHPIWREFVRLVSVLTQKIGMTGDMGVFLVLVSPSAPSSPIALSMLDGGPWILSLSLPLSLSERQGVV